MIYSVAAAKNCQSHWECHWATGNLYNLSANFNCNWICVIVCRPAIQAEYVRARKRSQLNDTLKEEKINFETGLFYVWFSKMWLKIAKSFLNDPHTHTSILSSFPESLDVFLHRFTAGFKMLGFLSFSLLVFFCFCLWLSPFKYDKKM